MAGEPFLALALIGAEASLADFCFCNKAGAGEDLRLPRLKNINI